MLSKELIKLIHVFVGYSQDELAKAVKVDHSYIGKVEQGRIKPTQIVQLNIVQVCKSAGMTDTQFALMKIVTDEAVGIEATSKGGVQND